MKFQHKELSEGGWQKLSLAEQFANIGSEISRAIRWQGRDEKLFWSAVERALELLSLAMFDLRWRHRLKEITRLHEVFCDAVLGGEEYNSRLQETERYFFYYALYSRKGR
ncbi:MAG: hypothetical protein KGZ49_11520 [Syntrophaceae bacterium]|nr:hypothetical protein [Syntrophaceae bacterium]